MVGFTESERFLYQLSLRSFLRFWSYPNLFRNKKQNGKGDGKEICDLAVVFGNDILLFSDKSIKFNSEINERLAWTRWYRSAVYESARQLEYAKKTFIRSPTEIFLDPQCTTLLPVVLPPVSQLRFHLIVVCHGIEGAFPATFPEPSLIFDNTVKAGDQLNQETCSPFRIGPIGEEQCIHIFNDFSIRLVLEEFDTAPDFTKYLSQRELLLKSHLQIRRQSESDLVQMHIKHFDIENSAENILSSLGCAASSDLKYFGGVHHFYINPSVIAKKNYDLISYKWDRLIDAISPPIDKRDRWSDFSDTPDLIDASLRMLASLSRFERRIMVNAIFEAFMLANSSSLPVFTRRIQLSCSTIFILVIAKSAEFSKYDDALKAKVLYLEQVIYANCGDVEVPSAFGLLWTKEEISDFLTANVLGVPLRVAIEFPVWDQPLLQMLKSRAQEWFGRKSLVSRENRSTSIENYPKMFTKARPKGNIRNLRCKCGSGKKVKNCCGRF